ncbi:hypothetical protein L7E55_07630 [Pelotomaculum isophthalicicum JI]|uniref:Uncharacterized protein n=1 Tax=Pelotomaculum isophthalicicum JI TaxID=947010 RepID=A0A9X4JTZ5_9FIRM|nr:hypothetical protein [Pelotomaculum isophthalicicum]MDF9408230.1 hypothetical protein [Pelotomaculum isophthalicicum JI]
MGEEGGDCPYRHSEAPGAPGSQDWGRGLGVEGPRRQAWSGPQSWAVWPGWLTYEASTLMPARVVCPTPAEPASPQT